MSRIATKRQARIEQTIRELETRFGSGIIYRLAQAKPKADAVALATGSLGLDYATGIGGLPRGRISELCGPPSCGKTSLAYHLLANAQSEGGMAAFVDLAQAMDGEAMIVAGVDLDDLLVAVPLNAVEALEIAEILVRCHALDAIIVAGLSAFGIGRRMPEALRKINAVLKGSPTAMVFVHEGNEQNTLAPLPFYASLRIALTPRRAIRGPGSDVVGLLVRATVVKNKVAAPGGLAEFIIRERGGVYREAELLDLAMAHGLIEIAPLGVAYHGELLGKSRGQALAYLAHTPALATNLEAELRKQLWPRSATR